MRPRRRGRRLVLLVVIGLVLGLLIVAVGFAYGKQQIERQMLTAVAAVAAMNCGQGPAAGAAAPAADGTPGILGPPTIAPSDLEQWWRGTGREQPGQLAIPIRDVIGLYISEGQLAGVRGDIALAQAIHETGWFTNSDTARNNFAGIGHYDGTASGMPFDDVATGVRAHIQLLKKYAVGNDPADLAFVNPDVAPPAGARATTWGALAGTWATDRAYWTKVSSVFGSMLANVGRNAATGAVPAGAACSPALNPDPQGGTACKSQPGITPIMQQVLNETVDLFGCGPRVGCLESRPNPSEHPLGRACDFMVSPGGQRPDPTGAARGQKMASWLVENAARLKVLYVIWNQQIWHIAHDAEGWEAMEDRGGVTQNHHDHVHVSVQAG